MPCIDIATLRSRVATALSSELGTYTLTDSAGNTDVSTALKVETGTSEESNGFNFEAKVSGLECVIQPQTEEDFQPLYGGQYTDDFTTLITLKQWDRADTTLTALSLLKKAIPDLIAPGGIAPRVLRNGLNAVEFVQVTIVHQI